MQLPKSPGMYIVTLNNYEPISVNAHDPRIADRAITVTRANVKVGKAKNLYARSRNYEKTFGAHNVNFVAIAETKEIEVAEKEVLSRVDPFRMKGRNWPKERMARRDRPR